jgi:hypothetical protein
MQKMLDKYNKREIVETSSFALNAPEFSVKKKHVPKETVASKRWGVVNDFCQLNTRFLKGGSVPHCAQELIKNIGNINKHYCLIDLSQ